MTKFTDVFVSKKNKVISLSKLLSLRGKLIYIIYIVLNVNVS